MITAGLIPLKYIPNPTAIIPKMMPKIVVLSIINSPIFIKKVFFRSLIFIGSNFDFFSLLLIKKRQSVMNYRFLYRFFTDEIRKRIDRFLLVFSVRT